MKLLVTGATGYVGGRLIQYLCMQGHEVIGTTRRNIGAPAGWPAQAKLITLDPLELSASDLDVIGGVDAVIHLAAANEMRSGQDPEAAMLETCGSTRRILEASIAAQVKRFIFLSTMHVYASPLLGRLNEQCITRPAHPYSISHKAGEDYVYAAHHAGKIKGISIRLSNSIGAPAWTSIDRWTLVGNDLARQAVETGTLRIKSPNQWRDFIPMCDVCLGIETLLNAAEDRLGDGIFNLGGDLPLRVIDVANYIAASAQDVLGQAVTILTESKVETTEVPAYTVEIEKLRSFGFITSGIEGLKTELRATLDLLRA